MRHNPAGLECQKEKNSKIDSNPSAPAKQIDQYLLLNRRGGGSLGFMVYCL